jgi:phospholipid/cholesterol/gamma-HCH transport system substrate-binding protein
MTATKRDAASSRRRRRNSAILGLSVLVVAGGLIAAAFNKQAIVQAVKPGEIVKAEFSQDYKLGVDDSPVKIAGTPVGTVVSVDNASDGHVIVSMKVDGGTRAKLGSAPSADIEPTTILGGRYYVSLTPGGAPAVWNGDVIPLARTSTPVELEQVLSALQPSALKGLQTTIGSLNGTLSRGGQGALRKLLADGPGTLQPAGQVANALLGQDPATDLQSLVPNLNATASVLNQRSGQLGSILDDLNKTTATLAAQSVPLSNAIGTLPQTLADTRTGLDHLHVTLNKLQATAADVRPVVQQLTPLLRKLNPVLVEAQPVVHNLVPLLQNAQPLVQELIPVSQQATSVLDDVRGPVLQRINGPIIGAVNNKWSGTGPFAGGGDDGFTTYQELGFLGANGDFGDREFDQNGHLISFQMGIGTNSLLGLPGNLNQVLNGLQEIGGPPK